MAMFAIERAANQFSPLFKEKKLHVYVEKIEIFQENNKFKHVCTGSL